MFTDHPLMSAEDQHKVSKQVLEMYREIMLNSGETAQNRMCAGKELSNFLLALAGAF